MRWLSLSLLGIAWCAAGADARLAATALPAGRVGQAYAEGPLAVTSGGACPAGTVVARLAGGQLPDGMTLDASGYLRGTPREPGLYHFAVDLATACSRTRQEASLEIQIPPLLLFDVTALRFQCEKGGPAPAGQRVLLRGSQPGLAYSLRTSAPWLRARPRRGVLPGPGAALDGDTVDLEVIPDKLPIGTHTARLTATAWGAGRVGETEIQLVVDPAGASWPDSRTRPAVIDPLLAHPETIILPSIVMQPPAPRPSRVIQPIEKLVRRAPPRRPARSTGGPLRSRIIPVPKISLPAPEQGPSKLLGPPMKSPPPSPEKKKAPEHGAPAH